MSTLPYFLLRFLLILWLSYSNDHLHPPPLQIYTLTFSLGASSIPSSSPCIFSSRTWRRGLKHMVLGYPGVMLSFCCSIGGVPRRGRLPTFCSVFEKKEERICDKKG